MKQDRVLQCPTQSYPIQTMTAVTTRKPHLRDGGTCHPGEESSSFRLGWGCTGIQIVRLDSDGKELRIFIYRETHRAVGCGGREVKQFAARIRCCADRRLAAKDHTIAIHTFSHRQMRFRGNTHYKSTTTGRFRREGKDELAKKVDSLIREGDRADNRLVARDGAGAIRLPESEASSNAKDRGLPSPPVLLPRPAAAPKSCASWLQVLQG